MIQAKIAKLCFDCRWSCIATICCCCADGPNALAQKIGHWDCCLGWVKVTFFWISNLHIGQMMYFGVKLRTFQDFFHFGTVMGWTSPKNWIVLSFKNIEAPCGWKCNVHSFLASLVILVPRGIQISVLFWVFIWNVLKRMHFQ